MTEETANKKILVLDTSGTKDSICGLDQFQVSVVTELELLWRHLSHYQDINALVICDPIAKDAVYDILSAVPSISQYKNIPIVMVLDEDNKIYQADLMKMGATAFVFRCADDGKAHFTARINEILKLQTAQFNAIKKIEHTIQERIAAIHSLQSGVFKIKSREEAQNLAALLSEIGQEPTLLAIGLSELIINGVEHGMLGISHEEKSKYIEEGGLADELERRSNLEINQGKLVSVEFNRKGDYLYFKIKDPGKGFDYKKYIKDDIIDQMNEAMTKHGRGISMAKACFKTLDYKGVGNEVWATFALTS